MRAPAGLAANEPDERYMRRALSLAVEGWGQVAPNPLVGAVLVKDGAVVGEGAHRRFGDAHAEVEALQAAGAKARGATLYVTLEPCAHQGKTPPCTDTIIAAQVARVVVAVRDPNPEAGGGAERLRAAGITVDFGPAEAEARELNAAFFHAHRSDRPWVTLKLAVSLDGAIADATRTPGWLSGLEARREVHRLRAASDAVAVGLGTVLADDPLLTVREVPAPRVAPTRVVFSREGRLPVTSRLAQSASEVPTILFADSLDIAYEHALRDLGVDVLQATGLADALRQLRGRGVRSLLVEGGARLAGALWNDRLVDRICLVHAPVILGTGALPAFSAVTARTAGSAPRLRALQRTAMGEDLVVVYAVDPEST